MLYGDPFHGGLHLATKFVLTEIWGLTRTGLCCECSEHLAEDRPAANFAVLSLLASLEDSSCLADTYLSTVSFETRVISEFISYCFGNCTSKLVRGEFRIALDPVTISSDKLIFLGDLLT